MNLIFMECDTCRAKPGTPPLCAGCLHNRQVIAALKQDVPMTQEAAENFVEKCRALYTQPGEGDTLALVIQLDRIATTLENMKRDGLRCS